MHKTKISILYIYIYTFLFVAGCPRAMESYNGHMYCFHLRAARLGHAKVGCLKQRQKFTTRITYTCICTCTDHGRWLTH